MKRCAILCSGPSLADHDLSKIDCPTIGVNRSYLALQSSIHVFTYGELIKHVGQQLVEMTPQAQVRFSASLRYPLEGCFTPKKVQVRDRLAYVEEAELFVLPDDYDIFRDGWIFCGGAPCAVQVAISFNFTEIIFCGLDLHLDRGVHFYTTTLQCQAKDTRGWAPKTQIDFFRRFKPQLDRRGIRVFNTSMDSAEDVFTKKSFESFWS